MNTRTDQDTMKRLRRERADWIAKAKILVKNQSADIQTIKAQLDGDGATVPEIAQATGLAPDRVLWYVAALRKYGQVTEGAKSGDYFRYRLTCAE